jgi:hypothetical protein
MEVDAWTGFTRHFAHVKTGESAADRALLLAVILADAINLGLTKMADSCPGITYAKLSWLQAWHIREETYSAALADLVNAQFVHPFAAHWGDGSTSSSDGQRFRSAARAHAMGNVNPKYGSELGVQFYTHISDQYAPFHTKVINVGVRDATYVLDGLLYHESDLRIEEHYTDTSGFTDHVFAMMQPRWRSGRFAQRLCRLSRFCSHAAGRIRSDVRSADEDQVRQRGNADSPSRRVRGVGLRAWARSARAGSCGRGAVERVAWTGRPCAI